MLDYQEDSQALWSDVLFLLGGVQWLFRSVQQMLRKKDQVQITYNSHSGIVFHTLIVGSDQVLED